MTQAIIDRSQDVGFGIRRPTESVRHDKCGADLSWVGQVRAFRIHSSAVVALDRQSIVMDRFWSEFYQRWKPTSTPTNESIFILAVFDALSIRY